jgi:hypothetical protein
MVACLSHRRGGPDELRQWRRGSKEEEGHLATDDFLRGVTQGQRQNEDSGSAGKVGNLGRGGGLERV